MKPLTNATLRLWLVFAALGIAATAAHAEGNLHKVNHIIVVMQENHSFDNYFGALPYVPGGPYHGGPCGKNDHRCVDGLSCTQDGAGELRCSNSNLDDDGSTAFAFHDPRYCVGPDLDHGWPGSHLEANFSDPAATLAASPNDGFVGQNDATEQPDHGTETPTDDDTMGFYTQADLPFYYSLAQTFAIDDRYFSSVIGPTFPNRAYAAAATSFGHLTTAEILPPGTGYEPITGTIYDLLDANGITWVDYFSDVPISAIFRLSAPPFVTPHSQPISVFLAQAAAGTLPPVAFVDPNFGFLGQANENDEHPPTDIRKGEAFVSTIVNAVRNGPNWKDSIVFVTYDEHGGFYDHIAPAPAPQGGALSPDGIDPGQCADLSNPPTSETPGNGANCTQSRKDALAICPGFTNSGPYPADCAHFDQLGFRVPFIAVSPFAKPGFVSHRIGDHTSILALIEKRFLSNNQGNGNSHIQHLTLRDADADPLEDLFNFSSPPSLNATIPTAPGASPSDPAARSSHHRLMADATESRTRIFRDALEATIRIGLVLLLLVWVFQIVRPFLTPIVWGFIIAIAVAPAYRRASAALGNRPKLTAALFVLLALAIFIAPVVNISGALVSSLHEVANQFRSGELRIPPPPESIASWPLIGAKLSAFWSLSASNLAMALESLTPQLKLVGTWLLAAAANVGLGILQFVFSLIIAGIVLANGQRSHRGMERVMRRVAGESGQRFVELSESTVRSVATGIVGVALIQATLAGVGFVAVGIPGAGFWALLALFFCIIQIGPTLILIPAVIYVFATSDTLTGVAFLVFSVFVALIDNVLKPLLLGRGVDAPMLVIFIGAIGGFLYMGIIGLFVGSVLFVLFYTLVRSWLAEVPAEEAAVSESGPQRPAA